jgi:transcriptional regulator
VNVYLPTHFEETKTESLRALIAEHPLGTLVTLGSEGLDANHIPFLLDERTGVNGALIGHVARNNAVWHDRDDGVEALAIFQGPSAYISPSWYATKRQTHEVVPTYNYAVVHVYGKMIVHEDAKWLRGIVGRLTKRFEARLPPVGGGGAERRRGQAAPWKMADAPAAYIDDQLSNIVGIEIPINRIVGKWKVSQNRPEADREGAVEGLRARGDREDAEMADLILNSRQANNRNP